MASRILRRTGLAALTALVIGLVAMGAFGGQATADAATGVNIVDFAFSPSSISVPVGTTVTWTNVGNAPHTATSETGVFDSGRLNKNGTYSYTFNYAGTFRYLCKIHPEMRGTVQVGNVTAPSHHGPVYMPGKPYDYFDHMPYGNNRCMTVGYRFDVDSRTYYSYTYPCDNFAYFYQNPYFNQGYNYGNVHYPIMPYNYWSGYGGY
jgi:plastocyanin